ncbi:MAG: hypothetical protein GXO80_12845 [Chlorobi bacterium]|nr:hypothetical protein [Chlorobiota bacterium]
MIKNFNIKYLPVILIFILTLYSVEIMAVQANPGNNNSAGGVEIVKQQKTNNLPLKKRFLKRLVKKIAENFKETKRKIVKRVKRIFSKRKAKKERMKSSFRHRHHNLFNILVFLSIFLLLTCGIIALFYFTVISSAVFLILSLILGITTCVIALIYFSGRYIVRPHFKS